MKLNLNPIVVTGIGVSAPIPCDTRSNPTNLGISCVISNGNTCSYGVQYTMDDVFAAGYNPATGNWATLSAYTTPATATSQLNVTQFATALRLNVTASNGTISIQVFQTDSTQGG